ncbi:hypothetical protein EIP91_012427 [Steccherinum ochraceum]|uniref:BTB domain-containing protein n=1 Tax=Steccherinum ochraceum TaxID=92696 RepID=A0A4R0RJT4_9APHY|nr:hypothetical protein EIP91_012427 [Steccherinum ochraceum]
MDVDVEPVAEPSEGEDLKMASPPFDKEAGDFILRSSDHVDFRIRSAILSEASSVFEGLFSLPADSNSNRSQSEGSRQEYRDGVPVAPLTETSRTLDNLLRFCYPIERPTMVSAREICDTLEAAKKYIMEQAEVDILERLTSYAEADPFTVYAIAATHKWKDVMRSAAKLSLEQPFPPGMMVPEMENIPAGAYARLQSYRRLCTRDAQNALFGGGSVFDGYYSRKIESRELIWFDGVPCGCEYPTTTRWPEESCSQLAITAERIWVTVPTWFIELLTDLETEINKSFPTGNALRKCRAFQTGEVKAILSPSICSDCRSWGRVQYDMEVLRDNLAKAVDIAVDQVLYGQLSFLSTTHIPHHLNKFVGKMFSKLFITALVAAFAAVRADPNPTAPGPGDTFREGGDCTLTWDADTTGTWKQMAIELMSGSNLQMNHITTVTTVDGTDPSKNTYSYPCPDPSVKVTPNSAIYFYQFTSPTANTTYWTTRFTIADNNGHADPPANAKQANGDAIPWGVGALADPSKASPPPPAAGSAIGGSSQPAAGNSTQPPAGANTPPAAGNNGTSAPANPPSTPPTTPAQQNTKPSISVTSSPSPTPNAQNTTVDKNDSAASALTAPFAVSGALALVSVFMF